MRPRHIVLALLVAAIWGFSFVVVRVGLGSFPPLLLAALRFVVAAMLVPLLPRPAVPWPRMVAIGAALFVGQFGFLFTGMANGMPPGLASVTLQAQAFLTVLFAAAALRELPAARQLLGMAVAATGLLAIGSTVGGAVTPLGFALTLAAAASWAMGNVLLRGAGKVDMLPMIVWLSLVPILPLLALSLVFEGPAAIAGALVQVDWLGLGTVLYLAVPATLLGFGIWGHLLKLYPAGTVAPFSLLVPIFGALSAALVLGERFGPVRLGGMALIMAGLACVALPPGTGRRLRLALGGRAAG